MWVSRDRYPADFRWEEKDKTDFRKEEKDKREGAASPSGDIAHVGLAHTAGETCFTGSPTRLARQPALRFVFYQLGHS